MSQPYFATGYIRLLYRFARAELSAQTLFQSTGFAESDLMRADVEMPFDAQMRLVENAVANAAPALGLRVGHQLQLAAHGTVGTAMQNAPNLQSALDTFAKFLPVRASFFDLARLDSGETTTIRINIQELPATLIPFFSESILFTLTHCLTFYTGQSDSVGRIELAYRSPEYGTEYAPTFGGRIDFDCADTQISFDRALLSLPSPEADPGVFEESIRRCRSLMEARQQEHDIVQSIETFLLDNPGKLWTVKEIAPLFAVSSRTLIRQLQERGTTYQALRDAALKRQALHCLSSMSVEAAALSLGFADTSSFRRTFKRWFGKAPSEISGTRSA